jgi:hypothetical protein
MCRNQKRIIHVQPSQQAQDDAFEMKIKQEVAIGTTEVTHNHDVTWKEVAKAWVGRILQHFIPVSALGKMLLYYQAHVANSQHILPSMNVFM